MFPKYILILALIHINIVFADMIVDQKANDSKQFIFNALPHQSSEDPNNSHSETIVDRIPLMQNYLENFIILPKLTEDGYYIQIYQNPTNSRQFLGADLPKNILKLVMTLNFEDDTSESIDIDFLDEFGTLPHIFVGQAWVNNIEITATVKDNAIRNLSTRHYDQMDFFAIRQSDDPKEVSIVLPNYPSREKIQYIQGITLAGDKIAAKNSSTRALNIQQSDSFMISVHLQLLELYNSNLIQNAQEWESVYKEYQTQQENRYLFTTYEHKLMFAEPVVAINIALKNDTQTTKNISTTISNQYRKSAPSRLERWMYLWQLYNAE